MLTVDEAATERLQARATALMGDLDARRKALCEVMDDYIIGRNGLFPTLEDGVRYFESNKSRSMEEAEHSLVSDLQALARDADSESMTTAFRFLSRCRVPVSGTEPDDGSIRTSYGWKHDAEKCGHYVSNGNFIAAALACGLAIQGELGLNVSFPLLRPAFPEPEDEDLAWFVKFLRWVARKRPRDNPRGDFIKDVRDEIEVYEAGYVPGKDGTATPTGNWKTAEQMLESLENGTDAALREARKLWREFSAMHQEGEVPKNPAWIR